MNVSTIRERLASAVSTVTPKLNYFGYTPDSISPPTFYAGEVELAWAEDGRLTFNGEPILDVTMMLLVSRADDRAGQGLLDGYMTTSGAASIKAALETDKTLAGACGTLHVHHIDGYRQYTVGEKTYYGARFRVLVLPA